MGKQMQIGCQMAFNDFTSPKYIAEAAQFVEEFGFAEFWVPEHVMFFPSYESKYPYSEDGRIGGEPRSGDGVGLFPTTDGAAMPGAANVLTGDTSTSSKMPRDRDRRR